ncbi:MAG: endonuclease/exonuclease/phosphatase family protein [Rhodobacteraceae bacterium]|nr:endonuclease/exonuclease/phosphatase family protein [Paracoccaceae bacterium]
MQIPGGQDAAAGVCRAWLPALRGAREKGYNGVAILSRQPIRDAGHVDHARLGQARHVAARLENGVTIENFYVPAGGDVPDRQVNPKFGQKLDMLVAMRDRFRASRPSRTILVGDLNIAPREDDVWSHKQLLGWSATPRSRSTIWVRCKRPAPGPMSQGPTSPRASSIPGGPIGRATGRLRIAAAGLTISGPVWIWRPPHTARGCCARRAGGRNPRTMSRSWRPSTSSAPPRSGRRPPPAASGGGGCNESLMQRMNGMAAGGERPGGKDKKSDEDAGHG